MHLAQINSQTNNNILEENFSQVGASMRSCLYCVSEEVRMLVQTMDNIQAKIINWNKLSLNTKLGLIWRTWAGAWSTAAATSENDLIIIHENKRYKKHIYFIWRPIFIPFFMADCNKQRLLSFNILWKTVVSKNYNIVLTSPILTSCSSGEFLLCPPSPSWS